jgi:hypothetical protein
MMGRLKSDQGQLLCEFRLGDAVPADHLVRKIGATPPQCTDARTFPAVAEGLYTEV